MGLWVLLTVSVFASAEPNCNNPLISTANWPTDLQRPRYLTTPQAISNSTFCTKFQSASTSTCCDQNTIQDIVSLFNSRKDKMKTKGEGLQGGVKDTFNDFDPANQKSKGVSAPSGSGRFLQTSTPGGQGSSPPSGGQGTNPPTGGQGSNPPTGGQGTNPPTGGQGTNPPSGGQGTNPPTGGQGSNPPTGGQGTNPPTGGQGTNPTNTTSSGSRPPMGPPPKEDRPEGFNTYDVPEGNLTAPTPPQGRGEEKKRPGLLKMSETAQQSISQITRDMSALMQQFAHNMGKCMMAQLKHMAGMMCLGCDPNWESWVSGSGSSITVTLKDTACDELTDACLGFVREAQSLPALVETMKASIKAVIDSEIAAGTISASDVPTDDLSSQTKPAAQVAPVCSTDAECRTFICEEMSKGKGGVAPEPSQVADPASVSKSRLLAASVSYQYSSSGYDSVGLGTTATQSTASTSTTGAFIDGVSTETAPLSESAAVVLALAALLLTQ